MRAWPRPADAPGRGLDAASRPSPARIFAGVFAAVPGKDLAGGLHGRPRQGSCRGSSSSGSYVDSQAFGLHKDLHATTQAPLSLGLNVVDGVRTLRLKGGDFAGVGQVAPARLLPGLCRPPGKGVAGGSHFAPFALHASGLTVALAVSYLCFFCLAKHGHRRGYDYPCTSKGVQKAPTFVH